MSRVQNGFSALWVVALLAFAPSSGATGYNPPPRQFSVAVSPAGVFKGAGQSLTVAIKNETAGGLTSSIGSLNVTLPAGISLTQKPTLSWSEVAKTFCTDKVEWNAGSFKISYICKLDPGKTLTVSLANVNVASNSCSNAWTAKAWTSQFYGLGYTFARIGTAPTTTVFWDAALSFVAPPTAVVKDALFAVTVKQTSSCGAVPAALVALTGAPVTSLFTPGAPQTTSGEQATITGNKFGALGNATITASAAGHSSATTPLAVYLAPFEPVGLNCAPDPSAPPGDAKIIASSTLGATIADPGFAEGVRALNVTKGGPAQPCAVVPYKFVNNITGASNVLDPAGNVVPPNGVSFVWDRVLQPRAAYSYTVTWKPEWFGLASANNRKTKICSDALCTATVVAQSCLSPALSETSLPGYPSNPAPACVSAEVWASVLPSECAYLGAAPVDQPTCALFSTTITDIFDPVFIR